MNKKLNLFVLGVVGALGLVACSGTSGVPQYDGTEVQGVTDKEILVGNCATTTGAFAAVGDPFNDAMKAAFAAYNATNDGKLGGRDIKFKNYDDKFDGANGLTMTKKLVDEDKVFALVGHFGTPTVGATLDFIKEKGVPMVYAATGISDLYQEGAEGYNRAVMPVQPIYNAEGRVLLARAFASGTYEETVGEVTSTYKYGLGATKVGVISTTDDAGKGMLAGIQRQQEELEKGEVVYVTTTATAGTDHSSAVNKLKTAGCDVVIVAANQQPAGEIVTAMKNSTYNADVITSYVSANTTTLGALVDSGTITEDRMVYTTAWLDATTAAGFGDYMAFAQVQQTYGNPDYTLNSYAMAGYISAMTFIHGLNNLDTMMKEDASLTLNWKNYVDAMEKTAFNIPMGGTVDFSNGNRFGVVDLSLSSISLTKLPSAVPGLPDAYALLKADNIQSLDTVWSHVAK